MSNESQDKKDTVPDVPSAKSYSVEGVTAEFDPGALQVHAISPELRQQMSEAELPRLDPHYLQDSAPRNPNDVALPASTPAATTQPSLRRMQRALFPEPAPSRGRGVQLLLVFLGVAIVWEVAMLIRTSLGTNESGFTRGDEPGPTKSVQISGARPNIAESNEPAPEPAAAASTETPAEAVPAAKPPSEPARNANTPASAPRTPNVPQDLVPSPRPETDLRPKPEAAEAPQPASGAKPPSKVLFPPQ
jgi:hypothetical protein